MLVTGQRWSPLSWCGLQVTDLTAIPQDFDDTGEQAHAGMAQGAHWLLERILPLAQVRLVSGAKEVHIEGPMDTVTAQGQ